MVFLFQRTDAALTMSAATSLTGVLCNPNQKYESGYHHQHAHAYDLACQRHGSPHRSCDSSFSCHHTRTLCGLSVTCVGRGSEGTGRLDGLSC